MICGNRKGFTLMELMVYMAILGVIVLIAGEAFSNSTKFRIRTGNMIKATQEAENIGMLFKQDVSQMGAKTAPAATGGTTTSDAFYLDAIPQVYMDPTNADADKIDSSSYIIGPTDAAHDTISFKRIRYTDAGYYSAVEQVTWKTDGTTLLRTCKTLHGTATTDCPSDNASSVEMATGVDTFKVVAATPSVTEAASYLFPQPDATTPTIPTVSEFKLVPRYGTDDLYFLTVTPAEGGSTVALTGFAPNYNFEEEQPILDGKKGNQVFLGEKNSTTGSWSEQCKKFNLVPNEEYELIFKMPYSNDASRMFVPGRDHMAVGFRYTTNGNRPDAISDFLFFPPTMAGASAGTRSMRFSVKEAVNNVCIAFTFSTYSPVAANGNVQFENVMFKKVESANYQFNGAAIALAEKKNVKAVRLRLSISRGGHHDERGETGDVTIVVPTPSNGPRD